MSQTLQNQILLTKSMNGIITLSDGQSTIISNGQITTTDISSNTLSTSNLTLGTLDLNSALELERYDTLAVPSGSSVSLWEKGKSYFGDTMETNGLLNTGTMRTNDFTFNRASSTIAIVNGNFQLPLKPQPPSFHQLATGPTTYAPNASFLTAQGFTGWGVSGTSYEIGIKTYGPTAPYYLTYFYPGTTQAFVLNGGGAATLTSQDYTLSLGNYIFSFALQSEASGSVSASILSSVGGTIASLTNINVTANYPNWVDFTFGFTITTTGTYKIVFSTTGGYACYYVGNLIYVPSMVITDGTNTSGIGGQTSVMNKLYINNGAIIQSGGLGINGTISSKTAYGTNSMAINSTMGTGSTTSNTNCLAIGLANLQNSTTSNNVVALGNQIATITTSATRVVGIGGATIFNETDSIVIGYNSGQINRQRNVLVGNNIGTAVGDYNNAVGNYIFTQYNGYGGIYPSYNNAFGYGALQNIGDLANCAFGHAALNSINGLGFAITYNTRYNSAFGHSAGSNQPRLNYCSFFGANTTASQNNLSYATAIGAGCVVDISNCIQLGSNGELVSISGSLKSGANTISTTNLGYLANVSNGIVDVSSNQTISGNKTITGNLIANAKTITPTNLGYLADVSNGIVDVSSNQVITGRKTIKVASGASQIWAYPPDGRITILNDEATPVGLIRFNHDNISVGIGHGALGNETAGISANNTAIGENSLPNSQRARYNTAIGGNALQSVSTTAGGNFFANTGIGYSSGAGIVTGIQNVCIGYNCGVSANMATANFNTLIGTGCDMSGGTFNYSSAIGYGARITASNQIVFGTATENVKIPGTLTYNNIIRPDVNPTLQTAAFTIGTDGYIWRTYIYTMKTGAAYAVTAPAITATTLTDISFRRIGGSAQPLNFVSGTQTVAGTNFSQPLFLGTGTVNFPTSGSPTTIVSAAQHSIQLLAAEIQDTGAGTYTANGTTTVTINTVTSGTLMRGGIATFGGVSRQITAYGTGLGGTGTYTLNATLATGSGNFTSSETFGWIAFVQV